MTTWRQHVVSRTGNSLNPVKHPTSADIIFAAGFYEGERSCSSAGRSKTCSVDVCQKDPEILYRLRELFGGSVQQHFRKKGDSRYWFRWAMSGDRGRNFLKLIYPYLSTRRTSQIDATDAFKAVTAPTDYSRERLSMTKQERKNESQRRYNAKRKFIAEAKKQNSEDVIQ